MTHLHTAIRYRSLLSTVGGAGQRRRPGRLHWQVCIGCTRRRRHSVLRGAAPVLAIQRTEPRPCVEKNDAGPPDGLLHEKQCSHTSRNHRYRREPFGHQAEQRPLVLPAAPR